MHHHLGVVLPLHSARLRHHEQKNLFGLDQSWTVSLLEALSAKEVHILSLVCTRQPVWRDSEEEVVRRSVGEQAMCKVATWPGRLVAVYKVATWQAGGCHLPLQQAALNCQPATPLVTRHRPLNPCVHAARSKTSTEHVAGFENAECSQLIRCNALTWIPRASSLSRGLVGFL